MNIFIEGEAAAKLADHCWLAFEDKIDVETRGMLLIGDAREGAFVHFLDRADFPTRGIDFGGDLVDRFFHAFFFSRGVQNKQTFVLLHNLPFSIYFHCLNSTLAIRQALENRPILAISRILPNSPILTILPILLKADHAIELIHRLLNSKINAAFRLIANLFQHARKRRHFRRPKRSQNVARDFA